ncbi:hypothetical protein ACOME3_003370 [Neoechinorhynchus agilis]
MQKLPVDFTVLLAILALLVGAGTGLCLVYVLRRKKSANCVEGREAHLQMGNVRASPLGSPHHFYRPYHGEEGEMQNEPRRSLEDKSNDDSLPSYETARHNNNLKV